MLPSSPSPPLSLIASVFGIGVGSGAFPPGAGWVAYLREQWVALSLSAVVVNLAVSLAASRIRRVAQVRRFLLPKKQLISRPPWMTGGLRWIWSWWLPLPSCAPSEHPRHSHPCQSVVERCDGQRVELNRDAEMSRILRRLREPNCYSILVCDEGTGCTSLLRRMESEAYSVKYISLDDAVSTEDVVRVLQRDVGSCRSGRMPLALALVNRLLLTLVAVIAGGDQQHGINGLDAKGEADDEDGGREWNELTQLVESLATEVLALGALRPVLLLDHVSQLEEPTRHRLQRWAAAAHNVLHIAFVVDVPYDFFGRYGSQLNILAFRDPPWQDVVRYVQHHCPSLSAPWTDEEGLPVLIADHAATPTTTTPMTLAHRLVFELCGTSVGYVDRACRVVMEVVEDDGVMEPARQLEAVRQRLRRGFFSVSRSLHVYPILPLTTYAASSPPGPRAAAESSLVGDDWVDLAQWWLEHALPDHDGGATDAAVQHPLATIRKRDDEPTVLLGSTAEEAVGMDRIRLGLLLICRALLDRQCAAVPAIDALIGSSAHCLRAVGHPEAGRGRVYTYVEEPVSLSFHEACELASLPVFVRLLAQRAILPLRTSWDRMSFRAPYLVDVFEWLLGRPGSAKRVESNILLERLAGLKRC